MQTHSFKYHLRTGKSHNTKAIHIIHTNATVFIEKACDRQDHKQKRYVHIQGPMMCFTRNLLVRRYRITEKHDLTFVKDVERKEEGEERRRK